MTNQLVLLSNAVRESSVKRLRLIPTGKENWRPVKSAMSFADIAFHIKETDIWLFSKLKNKELCSIKGKAYSFNVTSPQHFQNLIDELAILGKQRSDLIKTISPEQLEFLVPDDRFNDDVTIWWLIVRGNLDHETHHRGQVASYLRMITEIR